MKTLGFQGFIWRRGWDSNPCAIARKLISSQPRYDHFDTSPYMLTRHTEINAIFSCIRIPVRTGVVLETMECPKTARLKAFGKIGFRLTKKISSAAPSTTRTTLRGLLTRIYYTRLFFICQRKFCEKYPNLTDILSNG